MQNNYYKKYIKYKNKYNNLKNMIGGASKENGGEAKESLENVADQVGYNIDSKIICKSNREITSEDIVNNNLKLKKSDFVGGEINTDFELSRQLIIRVGSSINLLNFIPDIILNLNEGGDENIYTFSSSQDLNRLVGNFILIETKSTYNVIEDNKPIKTFSIEGNVGTGKSTVIETLRNMKLNKSVIIEEPVHKWGPWLGKFLSNQEKHGLTFQLVVLKSYFDQIVNHKLNGFTVISERTPATGKHIFLQSLIDNKIISKDELKVFYSYFNILGYYPDIVYYLKVDPLTSYKRGRLRGRFEELAPLFFSYDDFKNGNNTDVDVLLFNSNNDELWRTEYKKLEISSDINKPEKFIKVNLNDIKGKIIEKLGDNPNIEKGDWIEINYENERWWIKNLILNNLGYLTYIHDLHEKIFNPDNINNFNSDNYFETDSKIGNKNIKVYVVDASKDRSIVSETIKKLHSDAQFTSVVPLLKSSTIN